MQGLSFSMGFGSGQCHLSKDKGLLKIGIIGDFSAHNHDAAWSMKPVDIDTLDDAIATFAPKLTFAVGQNRDLSVQLEFRELDDFHPDNIVAQTDCFQHLKGLESQLKSPTTFPAAIEQLKKLLPVKSADRGGTPVPVEPGDEMAELLNREVSPESQIDAGGSKVSSLVDQIIAKAMTGHVSQTPDPQQENWLDILHETMTSRMRELLHNPQFIALESTWRAVEFLVSRLNTDDAGIKLYLINVPAEDCLQSSRLSDLLKKESSDIPGETPWGLLCVLEPVTFDEKGMASLQSLAAMADSLNSYVLTGTSFGTLGVNPANQDLNEISAKPQFEGWCEFRKSLEASRVLMTVPRFVLRYPYGKSFEPIESFQFEELDPMHVHDGILWGNSAIAGILVLAEAWQEIDDGHVPISGAGQVEDLPFCIINGNSGSTIVPCGEFLLPERVYTQLFQEGFSPVISFKDQPLMRIMLRPVKSE